MLVFISDLHLKDGTSGTSITPDAFRIFSQRLREQAFRASWRAGDTRYQPIESFDIVLLGDVFDQIRSVKWLEEDAKPVTIRPWDDPYNPEFIAKIQSINDHTLVHNAESFEIIKGIHKGEIVTLPPAKNNGSPDWEASEQLPIKVRIHYFVGNHDWVFYLPGKPYDQMRQKVVEAMGLANLNTPFLYKSDESPLLAEILECHHVYARHGDIFDPMNYDEEKGRAAPALGDVLAVELLDRFPYDVHQQMGNELPFQFSEGLKELANVRPALVTPFWVGHLINSYTSNRAQADEIKSIWNNLVKRFLQLEHLRSYDKRFKFDIVDALQGALFLAKELPFETINRMLGWIGEKMYGNKVSIAKHALKEEAFLNKTAKYIVYGHTHFHEILPLDSSFVHGKAYNQYYINTGTWHSYHDLALHDPSQHKFLSMNVMTYLTFFKDDERNQHGFESWSGSLDMSPLQRELRGSIEKEV